SSQPVSVRYTTADGTAHAGSDYVSASGTLAFNPASGSGVPVLRITKAGNQLVISWTNSTGALFTLQARDTLSGSTPWATVTNAPTVKGEEYTVRLEEGSGAHFYRLATPSLTFYPGETNKTITIQVRGDLLNEPDETFFVNLSNPTNALIARGTGIGTIINDDAAAGLTVDDVRVVEGNSGTTNAILTLSLSQA